MDCADGDLQAVSALRKVLAARCARSGQSAEYADAIFVDMVGGVMEIRKQFTPAYATPQEGQEAGEGNDSTTALPGNTGTEHQATGGQDVKPHHSALQPRTDVGSFRMSLWRHFGNVLPQVRGL